jgi:thioredoxin reductase
MKGNHSYEVIITGGSYSGLAAGMTLGRAVRKVLIIDSGLPCNRQTPYSHNFLTQDGKAPGEIVTLARSQVSLYPTVVFLDAVAEKAVKGKDGFEVQVSTGEIFTARKLIFGTGVKEVMPPVPGVSECWGISVLHCPYCHGYEVRGEKTGLWANGDAGFEMAMMISHWTKDLTLFTNGKETFHSEQRSKLDGNKIVIDEKEIAEIVHSKGYIRDIVFKDGSRLSLKALYIKLPFVQHCSIPQALGCELTDEGYIKVDGFQRTTVPGVLACGDNTTRMRTVAGSVAMGTAAGMMANREMREEEF